jgi:hypothetical protein
MQFSPTSRFSDAAREAMTVRDLDYTLDTRNTLLQAGEWLLRASLREGLSRRAVFPLHGLDPDDPRD